MPQTQQIHPVTPTWTHELVDAFLSPAGSMFQGNRRRVSVALILSVLVIVTTAVFFRGRIDPKVIADKHASLSFKQAFNLANCGSTNILSIRQGLFMRILSSSDYVLPLRDVIRVKFGSVAGYCRQEINPYMNNENGLMLIAYTIFRVHPDASLRQTERAFEVIRWLLVATFVFAWLRIGGGLLTAWAAAVFAGTVLADQAQASAAFALYSWLVPMILASIGYYALFISDRLTPRRLCGVMFVGGIIAAMTYDFRSTYLLVALSIALFYAMVALNSIRHSQPQVRWVTVIGAVALSFVAGFLLVQRVWLEPKLATRYAENYSYHSVAHPLVLGMALPSTDLSRREGIEWDDDVGIVLARRVDPAVEYLDSGYERALFSYYRRLWRSYPGEMLSLYRQKARIAGVDLIEHFHDLKYASAILALPMAPYALVHDGLLLTIGFVIVGVIAIVSAIRLGSPAAFIVGVFAAIAGLLQLEATIIEPYFYITLYGVSLFCFAFLVVLAGEAIVALAGARRQSTSEVGERASPAGAVKLAIADLTLGIGALLIVGWAVGVFTGAAADISLIASCATVAGVLYAVIRRLSSPIIGYAASLVFVLLTIGAAGSSAAPSIRRRAVYDGKEAELLDKLRPRWLEAGDLKPTYLAKGGALTGANVLSIDAAPDADYAYLLVTSPIDVNSETTVLATGYLGEGAATIGLQNENGWETYVNVSSVGQFAVTLPVSSRKLYTIVVATASTKGRRCTLQDVRFATIVDHVDWLRWWSAVARLGRSSLSSR
jgi:hypothetical protein